QDLLSAMKTRTTLWKKIMSATVGGAVIFPLRAASAQWKDAKTVQGRPDGIKAEFIFEESRFPASHASTIVETTNGLLAAWFAGPMARHPEASIWSARYNGK